MPITARQARVAYEKDQSIGESHKEVVTASKKKNVVKSKPAEKQGEPMMKRVRRKLYEVYHGGNAYMPKKDEIIVRVKKKIEPIKREPMKPMETVRTKTVSGGLKQAGLTDQEIARFRRKK
jgi:hypothetical protein